MGIDKEKNEQRIQLNRQHLKEWNDLLSNEIRTHIALDDQHKQEHRQSYLDEINFRDRAMLATRHLDAIRELVQQNRIIRITMQKRHSQEQKDLDRPVG